MVKRKQPKNKKVSAVKTYRSTSKSAKPESNNNLKYLLIIALLVLVLMWVVKKNNENNYMMQPQVEVDNNSYPKINSSEDLDGALKEIDKTDPVNLDSEIKGLETDSSSI